VGVDLHVVFATTITADEAFALPDRLNSAPAVVAACRDYYDQMKPSRPGLELSSWSWDELSPAVTAPSAIVQVWGSRYGDSVLLTGTPGLLWLRPDQIKLSPGVKLSGFASDYQRCQTPIRRVCCAIARFFGTDRVLYLPDSGDWPAEVGDLDDTRFDEALARLTAWGPPVSAFGALGYGRAVRSGYHHTDGALRRSDGTPVPEEEIMPGYNWHHSGEIVHYPDGRPVPAEELARPDLRGGFAYYVDDFRDLAG
jgi:hypothetical protein